MPEGYFRVPIVVGDVATMSTPIVITRAERDGILAALRYWQHARTTNDNRLVSAVLPEAIEDIATDGGGHAPLTLRQIDHLCERINR